MPPMPGPVSSSLPSLLNGVSQQPNILRDASQLDLQSNCWSSVIEGLIKRHPVEHVAKLNASPAANAFVHAINRDPTHRYIVTITSGAITVQDLQGNNYPVSTPNGVAYITDATPNTTFRAVTVADYTFLVNTKIVPAMLASTYAPYPTAAPLYVVKQGAYAATYTITVTYNKSGVGVLSASASYTTGSTSTDTTGATIQPTNIVSQLATGIATALSGTLTTGQYTVRTNNNTIVITFQSGASPAGAQCSDSLGGEGIVAVYQTTSAFDNLPTAALPGQVVEVINDSSTIYGTYYAQFTAVVPGSISPGQAYPGSWTECAGSSLQSGVAATPISIDPSTMPMVLINNNNGTFTLQQATWNTCQCGDIVTNPTPSFIGSPINGVFFYKDRLGFISDENVNLSQSGSFFNFFRTTVTTLLESDPIDISASQSQVNILRWAVPFNSQLLLFSDQAQLVLESGQNPLAPQYASISQASRYISSAVCRPVPVGRNCFFTYDRGNYAGLREYTSVALQGTYEADDVIAHCPAYVPSGLTIMEASLPQSAVFMVSPNSPNIISVFKFYESQEQRIQTSISQWSLDSTASVQGLAVYDNYLYVVASYADGTYLMRMNLQDNYADSLAPLLPAMVDRKVLLTSGVLASGNTTFTLPYTIPSGTTVQGVAVGGAYPGSQLTIVSASGTSVVVRGDYHATSVYLGLQYLARANPSQILVRERSITHGQYIPLTARLQLLQGIIGLGPSGYTRLEITPTGRGLSSYVWTSESMGAVPVGSANIISARFPFPILSRADRVTISLANDSPYPSSWISMDWKGTYVDLTQRLP